MSAAKKRGRPKLAETAARRVAVRLYASDEQLLAGLRDKLALGDGEVMRLALHELAKRERVR